MSDWVWSLKYERGDTHVVLGDRDTLGDIFETVGVALLNTAARSWPWHVRLGALMHRTAVALLAVAERHTRTVAEIPADSALLGELVWQGLIEAYDEDVAP